LSFVQQGALLVGNGVAVGLPDASAVALSADGNTAILGDTETNDHSASNGAPQGGAWVFVRQNGAWTQQGPKLVSVAAAQDNQNVNAAWNATFFGQSVALSGDGNTALIGAPYEGVTIGATWAFVRNGNTWSQQPTKLVGSGSAGDTVAQGASLALSADGNTAIVGGTGDNSGTGAVWIFVRSGSGWTQQGPKLVGSGATGPARQGSSVRLSTDGNTAVIGGPADNNGIGAAWVFTRSGGRWTQQGLKLVGSGAVAPAKQGTSVALSGDGNTIIVGGPFDKDADNNDIGAVWVFARSGSAWSQQGSKLAGSALNSGWGRSVALSASGDVGLVGRDGAYTTDASGAELYWGAASIVTRSGGVWAEAAKLIDPNAVRFVAPAVGLSADGTTAIVGDGLDTSQPWPGGGAPPQAVALVFVRSAGAPAPPVQVQSPPPPRPAPPPQAQQTPQQPAPPATTKGITLSLNCGVAGLAQNLFDNSGLRCPAPDSPGKCYYVNLIGPICYSQQACIQGKDNIGIGGAVMAYDKLDLTCTNPAGNSIASFYPDWMLNPNQKLLFKPPWGMSHAAGSPLLTIRSDPTASSAYCVLSIPTMSALPAFDGSCDACSPELVVKGPLPCL
jgi:hypothetical protein